MLKTSQIEAIFGRPGDDRNLVTVPMPYPRRIEFIEGFPITKRMQCHKLVAPIFQKIHTEILTHYGLPRIQELGIDFFGGCYNFRKMRGGTDFSRHSWGIAEDLYSKKNGLKTKWEDALFSKKEYAPMVDIYYANGFVNQGIEKGTDGMHWEFLKFI